ncbi:hypothetical protein, partial [Pseudomonas putida]|uniref:hypothetical protein n=1 Tax=Pseudomonas putida TaxID=303 RepID=UPI001A9D140D
KEFFVPTALEVVRIIRGFETASTPIFKKIRYLRKWTVLSPPQACHDLSSDYSSPATIPATVDL